MANNQEKAFDDLRHTFNEYARIIRHRWKFALLGLSTIGSIAFWWSQYLPRQYSAATIFERRDDVVLRNLIQSNSPYSFDHFKSSLVLDMTGSRALADAATQIGILPADSAAADGALGNDELSRLDQVLQTYDLTASVKLVQSSPSLDTIKVEVRANHPGIARHFVTALRDRYIRVTRERITEILLGTKSFFESEVERYQGEVNQTSKALQTQFADFPGIDPTDPSVVGGRLETLRAELLRAQQRKAELQAQIEAREKFLTSVPLTEPQAVTVAPKVQAPAAVPPDGRSDATTQTLDAEIAKVSQAIADARTLKRMTDGHPTVRGLRRKLAQLESLRGPVPLSANRPSAANEPLAGGRRAAAVNPVWAGQRLRVELELDALRRQLEIAGENVDRMQVRVQRFAGLYDRLLESTGELRTLQSQLDEGELTVNVWRQYHGQLSRILAAEQDQRGTVFTLIEAPKETTRAQKPKAAAIFVICSGCGLAASALLVALLELLDRSFRSTGQVTRNLGIPILECVGEIPTRRGRRRRLVSRLTWGPSLLLLFAALIGTAGLAYASLEMPEWHQHLIANIDGMLERVGAPPTWLAQDAQT